jgi:ABC-2 type transport system ATP-binding protein
MIDVRDLHMSYGETKALRGISFSIKKGEVVGLLGPNGAGKSTAMRIIVGALLPTAGSAGVDGYDVATHPLEVQRLVGYLPENAPLYSDMLVQEYLEFLAAMRQLDDSFKRRRFREVVEEFTIQEVLTRPIGHLSKGYRQRVGLASALLHDPSILILDEPTGGLDPNQIVEVRDMIRRMGRTKTVVLSTHILPEVEASCGRAVILIDGRVRADGFLDELTRSRAQIVTLSPGDPERARTLFEDLPGIASVEIMQREDDFLTFRLHLNQEVEVGQAVADIAHRHGWPMRELRRDDKSLEQVFRELTETKEEVAA